MKVTSCYTVYGFDDIDAALRLFRDIYGCKVVHHPEIPNNEYYVVEDANGNHTDLVCGEFAKAGFHAVRINVDDIEEAIKCFTENGATFVRGVFEYPTCRMATMSSRGENIIVYQHK